ncbi:MAG: hypothetical protein ABIX36_17100 [Mucilaginibacter sp.]|uniref:hypothetical protein n=1 Tax=Mucilaginibacter sp. TaxID=1882438 RepID=UPI003262FE78
MIPIGSKLLESTIGSYRVEIEKMLKTAQDALALVRQDFAGTFNTDELAYLDKVILFFNEDGYISLNQEKIRQKATLLPQIPVRTILKDGNDQPTQSLTAHILEALNYEAIRKRFYPKFFKSLGISACVYCNSQSALSVYKTSPGGRTKTVKAKYQLDHYIPKDDFPFLSICFYNLYPVCGICNNAKKESPIDFDLYGDQPGKPYRFELSAGSLAGYLLHGDPGRIRIIFIDPDKDKFKGTKTKTFQEAFNIQGIYETQKDVAEELIIKSQVYTESYRDALKNSFGRLLSDEDLSNRILVGNYTDKDDIHKRPMAKFMQDIARQLDILK